MTGEITLTGQALQIGGVREKVLAAQRAGLKKVILPRENEGDLSELPAETREELEFVLADAIQDVLEAALDGEASSARPRPAPERQAASAPRRSEQQAACLRLAPIGEPAAEHVVLVRPFQDEGDSVDEALTVLLVREVVLPRADAGRDDVAAGDHLAVQLVRERGRDRIQLLRDLRVQPRRVLAAQRQPGHRRERRLVAARLHRRRSASCETFHELGAENVNPRPTTRWPGACVVVPSPRRPRRRSRPPARAWRRGGGTVFELVAGGTLAVRSTERTCGECPRQQTESQEWPEARGPMSSAPSTTRSYVTT